MERNEKGIKENEKEIKDHKKTKQKSWGFNYQDCNTRCRRVCKLPAYRKYSISYTCIIYYIDFSSRTLEFLFISLLYNLNVLFIVHLIRLF
jgi:hypothetical protein